MTTHELARLLLSLPDAPAVVGDRDVTAAAEVDAKAVTTAGGRVRWHPPYTALAGDVRRVVRIG